jgi:hypothetical protein
LRALVYKYVYGGWWMAETERSMKLGSVDGALF